MVPKYLNILTYCSSIPLQFTWIVSIESSVYPIYIRPYFTLFHIYYQSFTPYYFCIFLNYEGYFYKVRSIATLKPQ